MPLPGSASAIIDFPGELGISHEIGGAAVSDHTPVGIALDPDAEWTERNTSHGAGVYSGRKEATC